MSRMLEFCQNPELFACQNTADEIRHIVPDLVIGHCPNHNIMRMRFAVSAGHDEIQPFLRHLVESKDIQLEIRSVLVGVDDRSIETS